MKELKTRILTSNYKTELILSLILTIITMSLFCYYDCVTLTKGSVELLNSLIEGRVMEFYRYCLENTRTVPFLFPSGVSLYIVPTAIWNIPVWIASYFFDVDVYSSVICMIWARMLYVFLLAIMVVYVSKICSLLDYEKDQISLICVLCVTNVFVQIAVSYAGQSDLEWIVLSVIATYYYLRDDWKKFYLFVNLAMLIKPWVLPFALLLILYKEKDLLLVIGRTIFSCLIYIVYTSFFFIVTKFMSVEGANDMPASYLAEMINPAWLLPYGWASKIVVIYIVLAGIVFLLARRENEFKPQTVISIAAVFYIIWFLFAGEMFYRSLMLIPWLYIAIFNDRNKNELMMWISTAYTYAFVLALRFHETSHFFNIKTGMEASLIPRGMIENALDFFARISESWGSTFNHIGFILNGAWVAMSVIVVVMIIPKLGAKDVYPDQIPNRSWVNRMLLIINIFAIVLLDMSALISFANI